MYKLIRIYDVNKSNDNEVISAKYDVLSELSKFDYGISTERELIDICKSKNMPDINEGCMYSVVKYENNIQVADEAQLFYHTDNNGESFLDMPNMFVDNLGAKLPDIPNISNNLANKVDVEFGDVTLSLPNVKNYEDFMKQMVSDKRFLKAVQEGTLGQVLGRNSLNMLTFR